MAIARMTKVMIVSHRSEAAAVLEALQHAGIVQVLDAEKAMVTKDWPELEVESKRPKNLEELVGRLSGSISFLQGHFRGKEVTSALRPRTVVERAKYAEVVDGQEALELLEKAETLRDEIDRLQNDKEHYMGVLEDLEIWAPFTEPVESFRQFESASCFAGIVDGQKFDAMAEVLSVADGMTVTEKSERGGTVRQMLATQPAPGKNTVLITHTGTLLYSFGLATRPEGIAHVFKPGPAGPAVYMGMLRPDDWPQLAGIGASAP